MKKLVVIGQVFPEPQSTAAGKRMLQLIDFFQKENYHVTYLSTSAVSGYSFDLKSKNIDVKNILLNNSSFEFLIKGLQPDLVLFDRFMVEEQFGWKVAETCPKALRILDTEDLHFLRKAREKAFKQNKKITDIDLLNDEFKREIASILRCDLSLIISEFEYELLANKYKISEEILFYLPFLSETKELQNAPFSERKNFVSIGNFLHEPNWHTVLQLKKIWKSIKEKIPESELHIYGAYASEKVYQLHSEKEGFIIKGRADSVEKIFNEYRVLLAPIPYGAGLKGKLFESMEYGIPNITTSIGAEAMHGDLDWNGFIEDSEKGFVNKAILLYEDKNCWEQAQKNGYEILEKRFNPQIFIKNFKEKMDAISANLEIHRNQNFLGQILQHHTLKSTKYMGKWIEEKNKA